MANTNLAKLSKPWPDFLKAIDSALSRAVELHCIGGFVLMACYGIPRVTGDIDYMAPWIPNKERHELTVQLWKEYFPK